MPRPPISRKRPWSPSRGPFTGRTFYTEREYRDELARRKGFASWQEQQRAPRSLRKGAELAGLHPSEREARRAALEALALMRREGLSLRAAARDAGTTPAAVLRHAGAALEREQGRYRAKRGDRLLRVMTVLARDGLMHEVELRSSRQASLVGEHWAAIQHYLRTGDDSRLQALEGETVAGITLETDPDQIDIWERLGELELEDIYALTT
jgi:hypothetical protein